MKSKGRCFETVNEVVKYSNRCILKLVNETEIENDIESSRDDVSHHERSY